MSPFDALLHLRMILGSVIQFMTSFLSTSTLMIGLRGAKVDNMRNLCPSSMLFSTSVWFCVLCNSVLLHLHDFPQFAAWFKTFLMFNISTFLTWHGKKSIKWRAPDSSSFVYCLQSMHSLANLKILSIDSTAGTDLHHLHAIRLTVNTVRKRHG